MSRHKKESKKFVIKQEISEEVYKTVSIEIFLRSNNGEIELVAKNKDTEELLYTISFDGFCDSLWDSKNLWDILF